MEPAEDRLGVATDSLRELKKRYQKNEVGKYVQVFTVYRQLAETGTALCAVAGKLVDLRHGEEVVRILSLLSSLPYMAEGELDVVYRHGLTALKEDIRETEKRVYVLTEEVRVAKEAATNSLQKEEITNGPEHGSAT